MDINEKIGALRTKMREHGIDAYIVLNHDAHQSEYAAEHWHCRRWISGFDGSEGSAVITHDKAALWADGRYYIQAARQIQGSEFEVVKIGAEDAPSIEDWVRSALPENGVAGLDGRTVSVVEFEKYMDCFRRKNIRIEAGVDLVGEIWEDRPPLPGNPIFAHYVAFAGKTRAEKLSIVRERMRNEDAEGYFIASLDDIAWLFNLRGGDVAETPVFYAYAFVDRDEACLFVEPGKIDAELGKELAAEGITVKAYAEATGFLAELSNVKSILIDPSRVSIYLKNLIPKDILLIKGRDITTRLKAVKNETEIRNVKNTQVKDGVAMVKFIKWIKENAEKGFEEADMHHKLMELRGEQEYFMGASFASIVAYMENAASMHYTPVKGKSAKIKPQGFLLVDSGGQYLGGTTDITRTIVLGDITGEMRQDFTTVLKAHIALAKTRFLHGATGSYLDVIPRRVLWERGMDYKCGTGHGVGYFLSVHEGPQRFRMAMDDFKLEPGMLITNEPGVYKEGRWGIRTENMLLAADDIETPDGRFMKFETISYCPIDLEAIDLEGLTGEERSWLNEYHAEVYEKLSPYLDQDHKDWLKENTRRV